MLADIAVNDLKQFEQLVNEAKAAIENKPTEKEVKKAPAKKTTDAKTSKEVKPKKETKTSKEDK
jgi:hypothetical protein